MTATTDAAPLATWPTTDLDPTLPTLVVDALEAIWRGEAIGYSEAKLRANTAEAERDLAALHARRITPRRLVGQGGTKKQAVEWLTGRIEVNRRDLAARGRTNKTNRSNARSRALDAVDVPRIAALRVERDRLKAVVDVAWVAASALHPDPNDMEALREPPFLAAKEEHLAVSRVWFAAAAAWLDGECPRVPSLPVESA